MNILLSSIGSRGDVQALVALALELRKLGHRPRLCAAPNFREWIASFGLPCVSTGPDLRQLASSGPSNAPMKLSDEQLQQLAVHAVRTQFPVLTAAARGCDLIIAASALQIATRSVAEALGVPYIFAAYCPAVLPSLDHPPAKMGTHYLPTLSTDENRQLWVEDEQSFNDRFRETLNEERARLGLAPVESVRRHIFTERPWLAADPTLGPAAATDELQIAQDGAWLLPDPQPLPDRVEQFLAAGQPPVYFGFGSMRASEDTGRILVRAARELGLRSIVSRGWGNLAPDDEDADCLVIDDASHEKLFPRVAAVVHHGGAGTTTAAALAGRSQVIVPHLYDQYYWAHRMETLGVGVQGPLREHLTVDGMVAALRECLQPEMAAQANALAANVVTNGARLATERVHRQFGSRPRSATSM